MSDEQYGEGTRNTTLSMGQSEEHGLHRMRQFQDGANNIVGKGNGVMGDVEKILNIPLSNKDTLDYLYWGWDERACADCLPTAEALWKKFVPCRLECIHNDADMESTLHIFAECKVAKACYRLAKLNIRVEGFTDFKEWFGHNLSSLCIEKQSVLAMLCWALWEARNHKIWNNITLTPRAIVEGERRVSNLKNRVGKLRSEIEIEATTANIEEPSHFYDLVAAIKCLQDSFVDVNFVGDVCFKVRKAKVVLRDLMVILSEYDEPETNASTSSAAAVKPFKASLDPANPLGFLETTLEFLARESDLFNSDSLINDVNAVVRMVKDKVDTEERKRKQKEKAANGNIEKKMKEPPIVAAAPSVPVKEVEVEGEKTTGTTEDVAYAVVLVLDAGMIPRTSTTPYVAIETPLNPRSMIDQEAFDRWKGHAALTLRATMFLMSQGLTHETVSWFDSYYYDCENLYAQDRVFIYRLIRLSALELVSKAVKMAVGTDLIKMMNPIVVNRYKRFSKGGLAAQIVAGPLSALIDMSAFESKYKDPSSIKWTVNTTSEKSVELMSMRIPSKELLMVLLQLEMETS
nr:protein BOBBER 1-like [Ipomoea batatas]